MRARKHLRPDTFPFLAVLLCAMGSLILLLLIMDRKAKAVARAKALQAVTRVAEEEERVRAARQAEWERRCRALHASLLQQEDEVQQQVRAVQGRMTAATGQLRTEEGRRGDLQRALQEEQTRLVDGARDLAAGRARVAEAERQTQATRAELAVLNGNLRQLEQTLADLRAARRRAEQTYSVVPYRGKRGDNRRPLYVECTAAGLVFHPDRQVLAGTDFTPVAVRTEIERRIARQRERLKAAGTSGDKSAYLLFLVRPDGVGSYTLTLGAVRALEVEFGYELIDRDWLLDFPADEDTAGAQPWMTAETKPLPAPAPASGPAPRGYASGPGEAVPVPEGPAAEKRSPGTAGTGPGAGGPPVARAGGASGPRIGFDPGPASGGATSGRAGDLASGPSFAISRFAPAGAAGGGGTGAAADFGPGASPAREGPAAVAPGRVLGTPGTAQAPGPGTIGGLAPSQSPAGSTPGTASGTVGTRGSGGAGLGPAGPALPQGVAGFAPAGPFAPPGTDSAPGSSVAGPAPPPGASGSGSRSEGAGGTAGPAFGPASAPPPQGTGGSAPANPFVPGGGSGPGSSGSAPAPSPGDPATGTASAPAGAAAPPGGAAGPSGTAPGGAATGTGGGSGQGEEPASGTSDRTLNLNPPIPTTERRPPPAPRPPRLVGNRDWTILVECTADAVVLYPSGKRFPVQALAEGTASGRSLVETVRGMIARRQAMVRPGEPPYRPQLRFLVRPDGLRTFYQAYPVLDAVQVPMSRQNLAADEEIR
jgi:hypothetical protein